MEAKKWWQSKKLWSGVGILFFGITALLTGEKTLDTQTLSGLLGTALGLYQTILAIVEGDPVAFGSMITGRK